MVKVAILYDISFVCSHGSSVVSKQKYFRDAPIVDQTPISNEKIIRTESGLPDSGMDESLTIQISHRSRKMPSSNLLACMVSWCA